MKLRFQHEREGPVEFDLDWDGETLVFWIKMETSETESEAEFGIGRFVLKGEKVTASANFGLSEDQARELRDALTQLIDS